MSQVRGRQVQVILLNNSFFLLIITISISISVSFRGLVVA